LHSALEELALNPTSCRGFLGNLSGKGILYYCPMTSTTMTTITTEIIIYSEDGDGKYPASIILRMDDSKPDCPVTFWADGKPVFSLGYQEISKFCKILTSMQSDK
jgi:hypothetical protein